ncbi:MAG: hypothetical protein WCF61_05000 [Terriglobales bacterium]
MGKHGLQRHSSMLRIIAAAVLFLGVTAIPLAEAQRLAGPDRPSAVPAGYVITPFGYFHPSCVRAVADGETVLADGRVQHTDGTVDATAPVCGYPHYTARGEAATGGNSRPGPLTITHSWIEDGATTTTTSYGKLTATWVVPSAPTTYDGQTVYLFPGLVDYNTDETIIQPVLGWNSFFGEVWSIASWNCCPSGTTLYSTPVQVNTGDTIHGTIKSTCAAGTESCPLWKITSQDKTIHKSTTLNKAPSEGQTFNWAQSGALEVYEIVQCSDYPPEDATTFSKVAIYDYNFDKISNPGWSITDYYQGLNPQCNYGGQVTATSVTLDY